MRSTATRAKTFAASLLIVTAGLGLAACSGSGSSHSTTPATDQTAGKSSDGGAATPSADSKMSGGADNQGGVEGSAKPEGGDQQGGSEGGDQQGGSEGGDQQGGSDSTATSQQGGSVQGDNHQGNGGGGQQGGSAKPDSGGEQGGGN